MPDDDLTFRFNKQTYRVLFPDLLRPLTADETADLMASVKARGVQAPVIVDENGGIIDGINRCMAAEAAGYVTIPMRVVNGLTLEEKEALANELNECRRHMTEIELSERKRTRAEKRAAVAAMILNEPGIAEMSNRTAAEVISEKIGEKVSDMTVGKVRSQLQSFGESLQLPTQPAKPPTTTSQLSSSEETLQLLTTNKLTPPAAKQQSGPPTSSPPKSTPHTDSDPEPEDEPVPAAKPPVPRLPEKTRGKDGKLRPAKRKPAAKPEPEPPAPPRPYDRMGLCARIGGTMREICAAMTTLNALTQPGASKPPADPAGMLATARDRITLAADVLKEAHEWLSRN